MVKRKCGTCRHFKDGGIAGSGWCQHPNRKDIQHMVLVRKIELACRNSWDQDLWELADQPIDLQSSAHIPLPMTGSEHHPAPTVRSDATNTDAERAGEMFTDRITSISMPTRSQLRPGRVDVDQPLDEETDADLLAARSSVREARKRRQEQRNLERKHHQETLLQQADDLMDTTTPANPVDSPLARLRAVDGPMTVEGKAQSAVPDRQPDASNTNKPGGPQSPPAGRQPENRPTRREAPVESVEFSATPPRFRGTTQPEPVPQPTRRPEPTPPSKTNGSAKSMAFKGLETEPLPSPADVQRTVRQQRERPEPGDQRAERREVEGRQKQPVLTEAPKRSFAGLDLPPAVEQRPTNWVTGAGNVPAARVATLPAPYAVDPIDGSNELQTVRRCCATCRDFKQVGDGRTGWCTNPYAFSEKRMVQSSELACSSSLGVWWLPHDDRWLELADTSHHGRPTPLLDEVMATAPVERRD